MRLNQYIAKHLGISRRKADSLIQAGEVRVDGKPADFGVRILEDGLVEVFVGGSWKKLQSQDQSTRVLLVYKPKRVVTTASDPQGRTTVFDMLPREYRTFKTAGRLDYMSEGLLVLSENGHLILSLTHPKFKTQKRYLAGLVRPLRPKDVRLAAGGLMELEGYRLNPVLIQPASVIRYAFLRPEPNLYWYEFVLSEGRNRQIRKMAKLFDNTVSRLIRVGHGPFELSESLVKKGYLFSTMVEAMPVKNLDF